MNEDFRRARQPRDRIEIFRIDQQDARRELIEGNSPLPASEWRAEIPRALTAFAQACGGRQRGAMPGEAETRVGRLIEWRS